MKLLLIFFTAILAVQSETLESDWLKFKLHHEKNYAPSEDLLRFSIYQSNLKTIEAHNRKYYQGLVSYKMGINHFTDWTTEEFVKNLKKISTVHGGVTTNFKGDLPDAINWNKKGAVAPVKDQGQCGSSMIFSAVGTVEGANFVLNNKLVKFSEQCLIDCTGDACNGSNPEDVFKFIEEHGLPGEGNYPDPNVPGKCHYVDEDSSIHVNSWIRVEDGNETALQYATVVGGPVSVQIDATSLQFYISGIFDDDQCSSLNVNHAVLVVGYGREGNLDYWIVKNSWGTSWGEKGFIRMSRNKSNQCGIASMARVPILD